MMHKINWIKVIVGIATAVTVSVFVQIYIEQLLGILVAMFGGSAAMIWGMDK